MTPAIPKTVHFGIFLIRPTAKDQKWEFSITRDFDSIDEFIRDTDARYKHKQVCAGGFPNVSKETYDKARIVVADLNTRSSTTMPIFDNERQISIDYIVRRYRELRNSS